MKIVALEVANFMKLRQMKILLKRKGLTQVTGRNGAGKSTLVRFIEWMLDGPTSIPAKLKKNLVRNGADRAWGQLELKDDAMGHFLVTRSVTRGGTQDLDIIDKTNGDRVKNQQKWLKDLITGLSFDRWRRRSLVLFSPCFGSARRSILRGLFRSSGLGRRNSLRRHCCAWFFSLAKKQCKFLAYLNLFTVLNEDFAQNSLVKSLHLHGCFVGFDFGKDISDGYGIPYFFNPLDQGSLGHGVAQFGHFYGDRHIGRKG